MRAVLKIDHDDASQDSPNDWEGGWKLYSFGKNHRNYKNPEELGISHSHRDGRCTISKALRKQLDERKAFIVSYYEHGNCRWALPADAPKCRFDTVPMAGLLINRPEGIKNHTEAENSAKAFLRTYTQWCNGDIWWYGWESAGDDNAGDSCGGFYGLDDLVDGIIESFAYHKVTEVEFASSLARELLRDSKLSQLFPVMTTSE